MSKSRDIEIFWDVIQGTPEWDQLRCGRITASKMGDILAKGERKMRTSYLYRLAGERVTGKPAENYVSPYMERGTAWEDEARKFYAFTMDADPVQVGFVRNGRIGCSPDALLGDEGLLEIKICAPHLLIPYLKSDKFPSEHRAQCQGSLLVTERNWADIILYFPGFPAFIKREHRIETYLQELQREIDAFQRDLDDLVAWIESYRPAASMGLREALTGSLAR